MKVKKLSLKKEKIKAWNLFSKYIRTRDSRLDGINIQCITCLKWYPAFGKGCAQAGHFIPGRHSNVLFDERNCHAQCYNCNINLKGNWVKYESFMLARYGEKVIAELKELDMVIPHYKAFHYVGFQEKYKQKIKELEAQLK